MKTYKDLNKDKLIAFTEKLQLDSFVKFNNRKEGEPFVFGIYSNNDFNDSLPKGKPIFKGKGKESPKRSFNLFKNTALRYFKNGKISKNNLSDLKKGLIIINLALNDALFIVIKSK